MISKQPDTNRRHIAGLGVTLALAAVLSGCLSATAPETMTIAWVPPDRAQHTDSGWQELRQAPVDLSRPLSLSELADIALRNNPSSRAAWNDARAAAAQVKQARGYFMPSLTASADAQRRYTSATPSSFDEDSLTYGPGLHMSYLVLNFGGGRRAAVEQALQTVYAADYTFNRTIQDVLLSTEIAYYNVVSAQAGVEAAGVSVEDAATTLDAARKRLAADVGTDLEVLQAQAGYDQALYNQADAQGRLDIARGGLARAVGLPADTAIALAPPAPEPPDALEVSDMRQLIDDALARRPDIAALRSQLAAGDAAVNVAGSALWPSLVLNGDLTAESAAISSGQYVKDRSWGYDVGLGLQWTLFDGFRSTSAKQAAQAKADALRARLREAELAAGADVWTRYQNYTTAMKKYTFGQNFFQSASASYELALDSYKSGLKSILDLLNAEVQLAQARSQLIGARQDVFSALSYLAHAVGLTETGATPQPAAIFSTDTRKDREP